MSLSRELEQIRRRLSGVSETAALDAQVLLAHVIGQPRAWVLAHPEYRLTPLQEKTLQSYLDRLEKGEPLPYVLGVWEFYGKQFFVTPAVLIPRPETELLVEQGLNWLRSHPGRRLAADVGTGSGCIAAVLAAQIPDLAVVASDLSFAALAVAARNIRRHGLQEQILLVQADLHVRICRPYDLICANLPYIPSSKLAGLQVSRWEPVLALDGGVDGLAQIRSLLMQVSEALAPGGLALLEIEAEQGGAVQVLAEAYFPDARIDLLQDLAGRDRLLRVQKQG